MRMENATKVPASISVIMLLAQKTKFAKMGTACKKNTQSGECYRQHALLLANARFLKVVSAPS